MPEWDEAIKEEKESAFWYKYKVNLFNKAIRWELVILGLILLLGLALRLYALGQESLWTDEICSIQLAGLSLPQMLEKLGHSVFPPFYFMLLHYWMAFFGDSEFSTRLLSLLFGFLLILGSYQMGKLLFNREVGLLTALLVAVLRFQITYSQEVRMYSLMALLSLFSMYFFLKLFQENRRLDSLGYLLSSVLLIYTHVYGLFIIIAQHLYFFSLFFLDRQYYQLKLKTQLLKWFFLQFLLLLGFAPWLVSFLGQIAGVQRGFWLGKPDLSAVIECFLEYSGSSFLFLLFPVLAVLALFSWEKISAKTNGSDLLKTAESYHWKLQFSEVQLNYFLLVWLLTPIILPFIISRILQPIFIVRYTIAASLPFYLLAARGLSKLGSRFLKFAVIGLIIIFSFGNLWGYYGKISKDQMREAAQYIESNARSGDLLLFIPEEHGCFDYYLKRTDLNQQPFTLGLKELGKRKPELEKRLSGLSSQAEAYQRVWLVIVFQHDYPRGLIAGALSRTFKLADHQKYVGVELYLFEKK